MTKQHNKLFENYIEIFKNIDQYEDILSEDLIYSNRVNNILF